MAERIKLGVFDIDGTIRSNREIPPEIIAGFNNLWTNNVTTTVVTGRGYARVREILHPYYTSLVSTHSPLALENGGRIAQYDGARNTLFYPMHQDEIDDTFLTLEKFPDYDFVAYYPENIREKAIIWTPRKSYGEKMKPDVEHFANVINAPLQEFVKMAYEDRPCMLMIKPHDRTYIEEIVKNGLNGTFNEGEININRGNIDKASAVHSIASALGIDLSQILVAGNDHNDIPMLNTGAGQTILVGDRIAGFISVPFIQVSTTQELGNYLAAQDFSG